jgi:hypothetical protein
MLPSRSTAPIVGVVLALALASACSPSREAAPKAQNSVPASPPISSSRPQSDARRIAADLPLLPPGLETAARPAEVVRAVYEFAARHPDVLHYVPCFCGCEHMGHQGNDDCFVSTRDRSGRVSAWESHGMICAVCLDVARDAMQMHNSGATTAAIRAAIETKYALPGRSETPTPLPPRRGGTPLH